MHLAKLDSKGRISIPSSMRSYLGIEKGDSLMIAPGRKDIKLVPVSNRGNIEIEVRFPSVSALADVIHLLAKHNMEIISTASSGDRWRAVLDVDKNSENLIVKKISCLKNIEYIKTRVI